MYAVDPGSAGVTIVPLSTLDLTRRQSKVRFDGAKATLVGGHGATAPAVASMLDNASVALAAEQAGAAARLMEMSVEYAKLRHQFGRPIGAFQAIKHKLADMAFDMERMDSIVRHAATVAAAGSPDLPAIAAMAKVFCSEAFFRDRCRDDTDPRRHRLHLGAPGSSVLPPGQEQRVSARQPCAPPREPACRARRVTHGPAAIVEVRGRRWT